MDMPKSHADPGPLGFYSDAARRISDAVQLHLLADQDGNAGRWLAFRLEDGTPDPTLYDSRSDVIRTKGVFAKHWGAVKLLPMGMGYREAESYLRFSRQVAENPDMAWKQTDADSPVSQADQLLMPFQRRP